MFLKLFKLEKPSPPGDAPAEAGAAAKTDQAEPAPSVAPIPAASSPAPAAATVAPQDSPTIPPAVPPAVPPSAARDYDTTSDLLPPVRAFGQERALRAIAFGAAMTGPGFHIAALGSPGLGKRAAVQQALRGLSKTAPRPTDWVYVADFAAAGRRRGLRLPHGRAEAFARRLAAAVGELAEALPQAFAGGDFFVRRRAFEEEARGAGEAAVDAFARTAEAQNIAVLRTPSGYALAPMHDGKVVKPDVFARLPAAMQKDVETRVAGLQKELSSLLAAQPALDRRQRAKAAALETETASVVVDAVLEDLRRDMADAPEASEFLDAWARDAVAHAGLIVAAAAAAPERTLAACIATRRPLALARYFADVVVAGEVGTTTQAPMVVANDPSPERLCGRVVACEADLAPTVKAGALHRANGGYLIVDAGPLLTSERSRAALVSALETGTIAVSSGRMRGGAAAHDFEAIPLRVKAVLLASEPEFERLTALEPAIRRLFCVAARFADDVPRDAASERGFAGHVAGVVRDRTLLPVDAAAVDAVIAEGAVVSGDGARLSLDVDWLHELLREADHWARTRGAKRIAPEDIARTLAERADRGLAGTVGTAAGRATP